MGVAEKYPPMSKSEVNANLFLMKYGAQRRKPPTKGVYSKEWCKTHDF
uniref:Uncharacterized protein n=1 Tax=viral metagenome TaxID=1070528 RepID=A0A6C0JAM4_9ZZZZ